MARAEALDACVALSAAFSCVLCAIPKMHKVAHFTVMTTYLGKY